MTLPHRIKHNRSLSPNDPEFDEDLANISDEDYQQGMMDLAERKLEERGLGLYE